MTLQITADIASLTREQREHLSGFILTFPNKTELRNIRCEVTKPNKPASDDLCEDEGRPNQPTPHICINPADDPSAGSMEPSEAFGNPVALAFGGSVPLPAGATAAPYTADAVAVPTVPVAVQIPVMENLQANALPLPAPLPVAEAVAPVVSAAPSNLVLLDKNGLPWDGRIHASTKTQTVDGSWKKKKGVDADLITQVEAELRQVMGNVQRPPVMNAPIATANAALPGVSTVDPATAKAEFIALAGRVASAQSGGKIAISDLNAICAKHGLPGFPMLVNRLDLVGAIAFDIDMLIATR